MSLETTLRRAIERDGPIPLADYMAQANAHYYATRDPLGVAGDFITAPEISQMFGELIGLWIADLWLRAGSPSACAYVELGPGRGTLAADALRAMRSAGLVPAVHLVETSPSLRALQAEHVPDAIWHDDIATLPEDSPLLIVANEFFDALPIRQFIATRSGWRERFVTCTADGFAPLPGQSVVIDDVSPELRGSPINTIVEAAPAGAAICADLAQRIARQGGTALIIDYGYTGPAPGDTLQAVKAHGFADPFSSPGEHDLTAHVDFTPLAAAGREAGLRISGPVAQGDWLLALGIDYRAAALAHATPQRADEIMAARKRLADPEAMGSLFKILAMTAPEWPVAEGFADPAEEQSR